MTRNAELSRTFVVALVTIVSLTVSQVQCQSRTCNLLARPHPRGLCGTKLAQAHRNLCFLIRQVYPEFFPTDKRSIYIDSLPDTPSVSIDRIHDTTMAELEVPESTFEDGAAVAFIHLLRKRSTRERGSLVCECCYGPCTPRIIARYC